MRRGLLSIGPAFLLLCVLSTSSLLGQLEPPSTGGAVALDQELRMLGHYKRVLMIGAHPDDEDTELLTILVRGMGAEAAYLSLNRGEGGQNLIGPELGEALGLIRTEELLAARRLDGARQYFTRAYDFGYSKTLDETWQHWPRDTILKDVVRIVRRFRPQIIVSIFSGTPRDGHGQHQAAGWSAQEAFRAAGDSTRFRELFREEGLLPWSPLKLYRSTRFDSAATTLTLNGGVLDPAVGKSFHQIAMAGRSLHRSQDMGQLQQIGPSKVRLGLWEDRTGAGSASLFAGIDTSMIAMPLGERRRVGGPAELVRNSNSPPSLRRYLARIDSAIAAGGSDELSRRRTLLALATRDLEEVILEAPRADTTNKSVYYTRGVELYDQLGHLNAAAWRLARVVFDATVDDDRVVAGQALRWSLSLWNASTIPHVAQMTVTQCIPMGDCHGPDRNPDRTIAPGQVKSDTVDYPVLDDQPVTTPYFLRAPRDGDLYTWPTRAPSHIIGPLPYGEPFDGPDFGVSTELTAGPADSVEAGYWAEAVFRFNDQARGEVRRPVTVVPRVDVKLDPATEVWPTGSLTPHRFTVTLTHGARDSTSGTVRLQLPPGWPAVASQRFRFAREDERESFAFEVRPPARLVSDSGEIHAVAQDLAGTTYDVGVYTVDYPHIRPRSYTRLATTTLRLAPLLLPRLTRVGYIRGAADQVPEALASVGVPVTLLSGAALERGRLDRYDVIVVGPRAYETDSALVENNRRLLDYARRGGLLIVQYQQHQFFNGRFAPYPMTVGGQPLRLDESGPGRPGSAPARAAPPVSHDRVTDENAPLRLVVPDHPAVRVPNRLSAADWKGWVQERGLYFARTWDRRYRPVLETHDPGDAPLLGGLLIAPVGKGTYVYTGLSFFRQLPAGVPGAFRLFANLLALPHGR
ncbi:MAG TPA: PIG-L family deacetylase [Gemmatimonadales bacterium]|nr:PIG-L family deacetylase [Gemmatimonadales bacterium]